MVPTFPQVGATELLIVLFIILLHIGAKCMPQLARSLGSGTREFRMGICGGYDEDSSKGDRGRHRKGPFVLMNHIKVEGSLGEPTPSG